MASRTARTSAGRNAFWAIAVTFAWAVFILGYRVGVARYGRPHLPLANGKYLSPQGRHAVVGRNPIGVAVSKDGTILAVACAGPPFEICLLDARSGELLARRPVDKASGGAAELARAVVEKVESLDTRTGATGETSGQARGTRSSLPPSASLVPGVVSSNSGAIRFEASRQNPSIRQLGAISRTLQLPSVAGDMALTNDDGRLFVSCPDANVVLALDTRTGRRLAMLKSGTSPTRMRLGRNRLLYVANTASDTVSVVDTRTLKVVQTILVRPPAMGPGAVGPRGLALSTDEDRLFVALGEANAVAAVGLGEGKVQGLIPVGWNPTEVAVSPDGMRLYVACANGVRERNPTRERGSFDSTVSFISLTRVLGDLRALTHRTLANNLAVSAETGPKSQSFEAPPIKRIVLVSFPAATFDEVFGDLPLGNGEPSLCRMPREVTPNLHAIAERFGVLDNFYAWPAAFDGLGTLKSYATAREWLAAESLRERTVTRIAITKSANTLRGARVADREIGHLVETLSRRSDWRHTLICVVAESEAAGEDHVDRHRSFLVLVSPYLEKGKVDGRFYNSANLVQTLLRLRAPIGPAAPGAAAPMPLLTAEPSNDAPYLAR